MTSEQTDFLKQNSGSCIIVTAITEAQQLPLGIKVNPDFLRTEKQGSLGSSLALNQFFAYECRVKINEYHIELFLYYATFFEVCSTELPPCEVGTSQST